MTRVGCPIDRYTVDDEMDFFIFCGGLVVVWVLDLILTAKKQKKVVLYVCVRVYIQEGRFTALDS